MKISNKTSGTFKLPSSLPPEGAYRLKKVAITENGRHEICFRDQLKIYTQQRFMFAFMHPEFGIDAGAGLTSWHQGHMTEEPQETHNGPINGLKFKIPVEPALGGFTQTIVGMTYADGRSLDMVETWESLSQTTSDFDGLWQSIDNSVIKTKMIGGGHFILLKRPLSGETSDTTFCFGNLVIADDGQAIETNMTSSIIDSMNASRRMVLTLADKHHFNQTTLFDGMVINEIYQRL
ncbi:MAG: hypothetical protein P8O06_00580 [Porticoccaceae bacterium]|nr:hypothetical protein [Porticoccaceae bacterium]